MSLDTGGDEKEKGRLDEEAKRRSEQEAQLQRQRQDGKEEYLRRANLAVAAQSEYDKFLKLRGNSPQEIFNKTVANNMLLELGKLSEEGNLDARHILAANGPLVPGSDINNKIRLFAKLKQNFGDMLVGSDTTMAEVSRLKDEEKYGEALKYFYTLNSLYSQTKAALQGTAAGRLFETYDK